ncbi:MAG TPA: serine/threonine-protein kinase, partial [Vicinamibacteria bacterium]|nr:serine/threonine-protein kinase [Vicinamibacteria bacterium]
VAEGVDAVHRVGIVHRDLKTSNIMRTTDGSLKLMDFGIAKSLSSEDTAGATASGHIVGTPEYMSPEQARGETVDNRSDVYALGVVIFELLTGDVPFRGDTPLTTLLKHLQDPPPLDGPAAVRLPPSLVPVLRKALAKSPGERHASVRELIDDLKAVRSPGSTAVSVTAPTLPAAPIRPPLPAPTGGHGTSTWKWLGLAGAAVIAVGVLGWLASSRFPGSSNAPSTTQATAVPRWRAAAGEGDTAADAPEVQAAAREALSRARIIAVSGVTQDVAGVVLDVEAPRHTP